MLTDIIHPETQEKLAKKGELISIEVAELIDKSGLKEIHMRSPVSCKTRRGLCSICYGYDLGANKLVEKGEAVGIVAAQAIGEPGTQLTMRTFHIGGVAGGGDITMGLPRVEEVFEIRTPKAKAIISEVTGSVLEIVAEGRDRIIRILPEDDDGTTRDTQEYTIPFGKGIAVKVNDAIQKGQPLSDGVVDTKELFKVAGIAESQNYIIREIGKIYALQGSPISEKHIEVMVRQMFSRVRIKEVGDTTFSEDALVERDSWLEENDRVKALGKDPAKAVRLLMGISKTALTVSSFLSAASFQETTRVLINAAIEGQRDNLRGLKENVIIGRLIPAGTGFRKDVPRTHGSHKDTKEEEIEVVVDTVKKEKEKEKEVEITA